MKAAEATGIYYPTAKAINKVYKRESRVQKRAFRYRTKKEDEAAGVVRNKIPIEKLAIVKSTKDASRLQCGVMRIDKRALQHKKFLSRTSLMKTDALVSGSETSTSTPLNVNEQGLSPKF